jgi:heme oxygenase
MTLYAATRELHHACEAHPVGQRMSAGTVTPQEWADWLAAFRAIHRVIDPHLPLHLTRVALLDADLAMMQAEHRVIGRAPEAARQFAEELTTEDARLGAAYVLHGAHRRGGAVLAKTMASLRYATAHVFYPLPAEAEAFVKQLRDRSELADAATATFHALLLSMDEIARSS